MHRINAYIFYCLSREIGLVNHQGYITRMCAYFTHALFIYIFQDLQAPAHFFFFFFFLASELNVVSDQPTCVYYSLSMEAHHVVLCNQINGWQLAKMKKSIPDMSLP